MTGKYTPYAHLTTDELVREVCNKKDPTDLELELMLRIERLQEDLIRAEEDYASMRKDMAYANP